MNIAAKQDKLEFLTLPHWVTARATREGPAQVFIDSNNLYPLGALKPSLGQATLLELLPLLDELEPELFKKLHDAKPYRGAVYEYLPPIPHPPSFRDFYAFEEHVKTCRARRGLEMVPEWYQFPAFYFSNPGSLVGNRNYVLPPVGTQELDFELELGAVIGKGGRDIPAERALEHIAGFTIINDLSARDLQRLEMPIGLGPAKGKDFATAVGPGLVSRRLLDTAFDSRGILHLKMKAEKNGKLLSLNNAASMYYTWGQLIAQASKNVWLYPGDLIGSGTVGTGCILELGPEKTDGWLKPGDEIALAVERLGRLVTCIGRKS